jgi:hypothetical protein
MQQFPALAFHPARFIFAVCVLVTVSAVGYVVEWVGKLYASVVSEPFFLGSPAHTSAVMNLPDHDFSGEAVDVASAGVIRGDGIGEPRKPPRALLAQHA